MEREVSKSQIFCDYAQRECIYNIWIKLSDYKHIFYKFPLGSHQESSCRLLTCKPVELSVTLEELLENHMSPQFPELFCNPIANYRHISTYRAHYRP